MIKCLMTICFSLMLSSTYAQDAVGIWKTVDDEDGKVKSNITITEHDGKLSGSVTKLINPEIEKCTKCKGEKKDQPLMGMEILWDLKPDGEKKWGKGKIIDPKSGKTYKCLLELEDDNTLKVRGYLGVPIMGRTQTWYRVVE